MERPSGGTAVVKPSTKQQQQQQQLLAVPARSRSASTGNEAEAQAAPVTPVSKLHHQQQQQQSAPVLLAPDDLCDGWQVVPLPMHPNTPTKSVAVVAARTPPGHSTAKSRSLNSATAAAALATPSRAMPRSGLARALDVEKLTNEERMSRLLHSPKVSSRFTEATPFFEHFIVVGNRPKQPPNPNGPELLFQYPSHPKVDVVGLPQLCFPMGVPPQARRRFRTKKEEFDDVPDSHHHTDSTFVFLITDNNTQRYGVCMYKEWITSVQTTCYTVDQLCFCIITELPFLNFHQNVLGAVLEYPQVCRLAFTTSEVVRQLEDIVEGCRLRFCDAADPPQQPLAPQYEHLVDVLRELHTYKNLRMPHPGKKLTYPLTHIMKAKQLVCGV
eukprot:TRINITY_DN992_c0_g1_i3.p1 TRINITY_DN992_c0_g1~~TRINITY_DN992_c0_g1_i3.p1  ORF type:complete len:392 (+),score=124.20 TRINITY_DN992_c0_g1_i3:22-1176(+)